jgi:hypothetical protein
MVYSISRNSGEAQGKDQNEATAGVKGGGVTVRLERPERRSLMKGSARVILLVLAVLIFTGSVWAQEENMLPVNKVARSGQTVIKYDGIAYRITSRITLRLTFNKIDDRYVQLKAQPIGGTDVQPFYEFTIQWGLFPANMLTFDSGDGGTYTLDTETGYAEK